MPGIHCIYKRHLPLLSFSESQHHRQSRLSASERSRQKTCPMGRAVSEDCQAASAALLHSVNPLPSITRFARLIPLPRAARCKSPPGCLLIAHEVLRLKPFIDQTEVQVLQISLPDFLCDMRIDWSRKANNYNMAHNITICSW